MPVRFGTTAALIIGALALSGCGRPADRQGLERGETLLTVAGTGRAEAAPDQALFTAGLSSIAPNAQAASARNAETMNRITAALAKLDVPARDIQTRNVSVGRIDYGANRGRFEASNTVAVRVRSIAKVGPAIAAVTDAGANIVSGPNLSIADPERASLGAYGNAYRAARTKAEAYARAANLRIVRVVSIRDGGGGDAVLPMADMEEASMANRMVAPQAVSAPPVMGGTNVGIVSVSVNFALGPR
jgi:uncharacterized protein YggE